MSTSYLAFVLAAPEHPGRWVGYMMAQIAVIGGLIWLIVWAVRKSRSQRPPHQQYPGGYPSPYYQQQPPPPGQWPPHQPPPGYWPPQQPAPPSGYWPQQQPGPWPPSPQSQAPPPPWPPAAGGPPPPTGT
ncbi:hypothetical protein FK535_27385 [Mycolicibacterium sp. 018/SC-01/001]|uniref:hypothetical protein n=1 Tax=Mycolicibacterium sp. 018/SC-01/001 TaxID=2592069 RepID=UPI00117CACCE|nr:hypothetical protein [Mycolicibacterium sp. 018/SC-01/001]TRW76978.1 hypothetical protein FK535_27385 [Mycolicibacterium sp. 018/SC-01/001]